MKKKRITLAFVFFILSIHGIYSVLAEESNSQDFSSITIDSVPYSIGDGKNRLQEGGLSVIVLPDDSVQQNSISSSVIVHAFSDRKEAQDFQENLFSQLSIACPSLYKNINYGGDILTPCTDIPDTGVYGFANNISSLHIRKLNEFFTIVIPAEAGIHSGKHDGFLPSQE